VTAFAAGLEGPVRATHEAGPTGFVLAWMPSGGRDRVRRVGAGSDAARATDHVRTDRWSADRLVRVPVAGERHRVVVPSVEDERRAQLPALSSKGQPPSFTVAGWALPKEQGPA
jgi:transposase